MELNEDMFDVDPDHLHHSVDEENHSTGDKGTVRRHKKFTDLSLGVFNPLLNPKQTMLLYVRYSYMGVTQVLVFNHKRDGHVSIPDGEMF